jgi:hypothetical protein
MDTTLVRGACRILVMVAMLVAIGCGGEHKLAANAPEYPAGSVSREEIERQLRYDARVQDFEVSGDKLIVNVNQEWVASPPGLQQRAVGQWFGMWQAAQSKKGVEVVIRHDGKDVATWSGEKGYKHVAAPRQGEDKGESSEG